MDLNYNEDINPVVESRPHPLDAPKMLAEHKKLLQWYYFERDRQAQNRLEMSIDADFYDSRQWNPEDAAILRDLGQMPIVYNEVAPMVDWLIGTERRSRVDSQILPRGEEDVKLADVKTKTMKYVDDVNRVVFNRSRAFADAVKVGVGWIDDGARDDPTEEIVYNRYEDWRNILYDSLAHELDLSDGRYIFRWRWVDEDIANLMFPDRKNQISQAIENNGAYASYENSDITNQENFTGSSGDLNQGLSSGVGTFDQFGNRRRVKLIEGQYKCPAIIKIVNDGPHKGSYYDPKDTALSQHVANSNATIIDKIVMRTHITVFTEKHLMAYAISPYRHNRFSLTPTFCYRDGRTKLPYGVIRRVRDIQMDLNKRSSKALYLLTSNQIIAEEDSFNDIEEAREEAKAADGIVLHKKGSRVEFRKDLPQIQGQLNLLERASNVIQRSGGVNDENMGRQTNAVSGEAIKARQIQSSVTTTEVFDNHRFAIQVSGEKRLSLIEQYFTEEKVIRLTGEKNKITWLKINQPEIQIDGSVRYLNDITASKADYVVSESDYSGSVRQHMFDSLLSIAAKLPAEISIRLFRIAIEFSDFPNKDAIAEEIRAVTGETDQSKELSPEQQQQAEEQARAQAEAMQIQQDMAKTALAEQQAKVRELNAKAAKLESEAMMANPTGDQSGTSELQGQLMNLQSQSANEIDRLSNELRKVQSDHAVKTMQIKSDADAKIEAARINADAQIRIAEIKSASDKEIKRIDDSMNSLS